MGASNVPRVSREQAVAYRLAVNHLVDRLPAGSYERAAYVGLQDSSPRDALLGLHARVEGCEPGAWQHPDLIQTYSPRAAVYVLPRRDFGVFTIGRLPLDAGAARHIDDLADEVCRRLGGRERRAGGVPGLRAACGSGRIAVRWTTSALWVREVARPEVDVREAHRELCRRHLHRFGPTTPKAYAWWAGLPPADARQVWESVSGELLEVDFDGTPGWICKADENRLRMASPSRGTRLLVQPDLRLFGRDRDGRFVGPGLRTLTPAADSFHPHGILVDGGIVGAWGEKADGWPSYRPSRSRRISGTSSSPRSRRSRFPAPILPAGGESTAAPAAQSSSRRTE